MHELSRRVFSAKMTGFLNTNTHMFARLIATSLALTVGLTLIPSALGQSRFDATDITRIVSTEYPLPPDYVPPDLVRAADYSIVTNKDANIDEMKLRLVQDPDSTDASANLPSRLRALMVACEKETGAIAKLGSGYRSYDKQRVVYANHKHDGQAAVPGTSEHQAGFAVDIWVDGDWMSEASPTYACFQAHAWEYGFILSFPKGNRYLAGRDIFEPWHWRYVGLEAAQLMHAYGKKDWPAEFLAKLPYFRWLASHGLDERWDALRRAMQQLISLERAGDGGARAFAARVDYLAERVTSSLPEIGPRLALEYCRFLAEHDLAENVAGLRTSTALLADLLATDDPRNHLEARRIEQFVTVLTKQVYRN